MTGAAVEASESHLCQPFGHETTFESLQGKGTEIHNKQQARWFMKRKLASLLAALTMRGVAKPIRQLCAKFVWRCWARHSVVQLCTTIYSRLLERLEKCRPRIGTVNGKSMSVQENEVFPWFPTQSKTLCWARGSPAKFRITRSRLYCCSRTQAFDTAADSCAVLTHCPGFSRGASLSWPMDNT